MAVDDDGRLLPCDAPVTGRIYPADTVIPEPGQVEIDGQGVWRIARRVAHTTPEVMIRVDLVPADTAPLPCGHRACPDGGCLDETDLCPHCGWTSDRARLARTDYSLSKPCDACVWAYGPVPVEGEPEGGT